MKSILTLLVIIFSFAILATEAADDNLPLVFDKQFYLKVQQIYGDEAGQRSSRLQAVIDNNLNHNDWHKMHKINSYFNQQINYQEDMPLWNKEDYWASPLETIGQGKGDCEDYAISKYFGLLALGVSENKLRFLYARHLTLDQPHMVLIYFEEPDAEPLVLDNFTPNILPYKKRTDLKPIYSFNNTGLWMVKNGRFSAKVENSRGVSQWDDLLLKIKLRIKNSQ